MPSVLDLSLGALEIGTWLSVFLYGIITLQVYLYIQAEFKDHVSIQILVATMWVIDTIHTVLLGIFIYHITVTEYGQPSSISRIHWSFGGISVLNGLMAVIVQSFFAYRIRVVSGRWDIPILGWLVCLVRIGFFITVTLFGLRATTFPIFLRKYGWILPITLSTMAFGDLLNTTALCYFLWKRRSEVTHRNRVINKIMTWSIETGLITSLCALAELVLCITTSTTLVWVGFYTFTPKFYSISLLSSLNNRPRLRRLDLAPTQGTLATAMQFALSDRRDASHLETGQGISLQGDNTNERAAMEKVVPLK